MFHVPAFWSRATPTLGSPSPLVRSTFLRARSTLQLSHPIVARRGRASVALLATPTASVRTLLVWRADRPGEPFFAKLSLPLVLGGEPRAFTAADAAACVHRSSLIAAIGSRRGLQLLPETLAGDGFLIRQLPARLTPWFAIPGQLPALARLHRVAPARFIRDCLVRPFLQAWLSSAIDGGWTCDAHAQNLLVERAASGHLTGRFFVRDVEDASVDLPWIHAAHPGARVLAQQLDTRTEQDFGEGLERSLHGFFVAGPMYALGARRLFFEELSRAMPGAPRAAVRDPSVFRGWIEAERERRLRAPAVPRQVAGWLRLEQRVNPQRRSPAHFAPVRLRVIPAPYLPSNAPVFRLPFLEVPLTRVRVRADRVPAVLRRALFVRRDGQPRVRCFFHPMMAAAHALDLAEHGQGREVFWASPTASPRSLVVWRDGEPQHAFGLKVSIDVELLRVNRLIETTKLERAVAVNGCATGALPEPVSVRLADHRWGNIGRVLPRGMNDWIPGFSLFAKPLSASLARAIEHKLWAPLVGEFARLAFGEGLLPDLHQQNVLFHRAMNGRLVFRDLDSCKTDLELRWRRGKSLAPFTRSAGTLADLKLDLGSSHYDEAWSHSLRADWVYLSAIALAQRPRAIAARFDLLILAAARQWLGGAVVDAELLRAYGTTDVAARLGGEPKYSLNAMVHAWKRRGAPTQAGAAELRAQFRRAAKLGRATAPLTRGLHVSRSHGVLVASGRAGVRAFALEYVGRSRDS